MEPITRQEQLLDSIATGDSVELEPITREEMYLSAIAGSTDLIPEKPITRKEMFYEKILESGGVGGDGTAKPTQTKTIEVVENGTYKVTPDSGKVLSSVTAKVNVPERYEEGYQAGYDEGYQKGQGDNDFVTEPLEVTKNGTYTPSEGVDGFETVFVEVPQRYDEGFLQGFSEGKQQGRTEGYSSGYDAGVDSVKLQEKTVTENGDVLPDSGFSGMSKVTVAVPTGSGKEEQEKSITITENGTTEVTPDEGKTLSKVTIETLVSGGGEVGKPYIDTSKMTVLTNFFSKNRELINDLENFNTSNITNFDRAFYGITNLKTCSLDTSKGSSLSSMFESCNSLVTVKLSSIANAENTSTMFQSCESLESLEIENFNTSKCTTVASMFKGCAKLKSIPFLDVSKSNYISDLFYNCKALETVSLSTAKTNFVTTTFYNCIALTNLTIGEGWAVSIHLTPCNALTQASLHGMIENLADLTGKTAKTFSVGATNLAKIDEEHIAMLEAKNWNYS